MDGQLHALRDVLRTADVNLSAGRSAAARVWPTGFDELDRYLSGGLRSGELTLLGGPQGIGKTTFALQVIRYAAVSGRTAVYFSYEHSETTVLERLIAMEAADRCGLEGVSVRRVRTALEATDGRTGTLRDRLRNTIGGVAAADGVASYADRLLLHRSSGTSTSLQTIRIVMEESRELTGAAPLLVVDYLQKVLVPDGSSHESERVTTVVEGLKDLALDVEVPVLAVVAADKEGLVPGRRLRVPDLRGSSALAYEADVVLILNDKVNVVARHHLAFGVGNAERFRSWVVLSIEKNRSGLDRIDLEFRKRFEQGCFETACRPVAEQLIDDRVTE